MRRSITRRIILSYIILIFLSLSFTGLVFAVVARVYAERQAYSNLQQDAKVLSDTIKKNFVDSGGNQSGIRQRIIDAIKGVDKKSLDSSWALVTGDPSKGNLKVWNQNKTGDQAAFFEQKILPGINDSLTKKKSSNTPRKVTADNVEYLVVVRPLGGAVTGTANACFVLYMPVAAQQLIGSQFRVLIFTMVAICIIASVFGIMFARSIANPIIKLKKRAALISKRDFDSKENINTGDELEELNHAMDKMAQDLKEYDIAQKRFLQNASHELKTPLMSIQGYAEGIRDGVFDDNDKALGIIIDESTRLKNIVEELIFLSKLETMGEFYVFKPESMNGIIEKSVEKVESLALKNNIRINSVLYKDAVKKADQEKLIQAVINLLGNCIRHAKSEVCVTTANDGKCFEISVYDDGKGFEDKDLKNLFQRFCKGKNGDTGLGLAITKVIIEKHDGSIEAFNRPQGGAEFRIRLR